MNDQKRIFVIVETNRSMKLYHVGTFFGEVAGMAVTVPQDGAEAVLTVPKPLSPMFENAYKNTTKEKPL